ncbi:NTPase KAP [Pseudomonas mosselii]|uniref:Qat anti-phage system ATPase QatA n=1 Tax=Pseudomonas mosselii TaxID=78327 RepID=UPI00083D24D6|nr:Qat anti-phage system ATPase QatA [Pseudomonas mosselii]ODB38091.1 NTPase KAP [Pseudomonas mosselii]
MFLNDQETATDLLYYSAISKTVVRLIKDTPETPITIGVHGDWGAGKSSVLRMTQDELRANDRVCCIWFNGWTFEGFEDAKTVVIETIVDELKRARPNSAKVKAAAAKVLKRVDWLKVARKAGGFALTAMTGIPTMDQLKGVYDLVTSVVTNPMDHVSKDDLKGAAEKIGDFLKEGGDDSEKLPEHIHKFREEFKELLDAADIDQLVVIVDDLDRCLPKTAIETLEAIRLFLFVERTAFVIGADEAMIEYAVREHFPDLPQSSGPSNYARNYLEKLIQVPFRIPALGLAETRVYITLLQLENVLGADNSKFQALLDIAREDMKRPWKSKGLERSVVQTAMGGTLTEEVSQAITISAHVTKILSEGSRGNPRQIKRFLNSMMLRQAIAEERGFGNEISRPILAKIMLAERFYSDFYEQIARLASLAQDGAPEALAGLEKRARAAPQEVEDDEQDTGERKAKPKVAVAIGAELQQWLKSDWALNWARIDPTLVGVDLRPYVFVTRDKRSPLAGFVATSQLEALVETLMGPRMKLKSAPVLNSMRELSAPDSEEVFDAIRDRILQGDIFDKRPQGIDGLVGLVKEQPRLQNRLLEFIRGLPVERLGGWAASSWSECLVEPAAKSALQAVQEQWAAQVENKKLKVAAEQLLDLGPKR